MRPNFYINLIIAITIAVALVACKKDVDKPSQPPVPSNQDEVITTFKLTLTDSANTSTVNTAIFNDPDGVGGNEPLQFDTIKVNIGKTYFVKIELFNKSKIPEDTVSNEVANEPNDHQLFFHFSGSGVSAIKLTYLDMDNNSIPLPLGLSTKWNMPNSVGFGSVQIILKHQPGIKNGNELLGETDVDVTFQVEIQ